MLQGGGDMDLGWQDLKAMQHARNRGLIEVRGALVLDRSLYQPTRLDRGAPLFDDEPVWTPTTTSSSTLCWSTAPC